MPTGRLFAKNMASRSKTFEDLDLSADEVKKIGEAFKKEEFRKLFVEYAEEISNPENRKRYEEEITQLENEKGMDVQFIHPNPGHVLKTSIDGKRKAFINICQSDKVAKPTSTAQVNSSGRRGINWQIPHSHVPPREDVDKSKQKCQVFDVVFHPDTYRMADNDRFRKLVEDTAIDGIESQFGLKVDRSNLKRMTNMKYKGTPVASIIRSRTKEGPKIGEDDLLNDMPYPYSDQTSQEKAEALAKEVQEKKNKKKSSKSVKFDEFTEPKYTIIHRSDMDLQEYRNSPDSRPSTRPKELEIKIFLPLLTSAGEVDLDVFEQKLVLKSKEPAKYKLDIKLPYPVDDDQGSAKFDKVNKCLVVTLPVIPDQVPEMPFMNTESRRNGVEDGNKRTDDVASPLIQEISSNETRDSETVHDEPPPLEELPAAVVDEPPPLEELPGTVIDEPPPLEELPGAVVDEPPPLEDLPVEVLETAIFEVNEVSKSSIAKAKSMDIPYICPEFTFNQDQGAVSFVLAVRNVKVENISKTYSSKNMMHIRLISIGDGGFPLHYSFCVKFAQDHVIVPEHCSVDVSDMNVVVLLLKDRSSRGIWDCFHAGLSEDNLQEYLFMTESNLQRELAELEAEAALQKQDQYAAMQDSPVIQVTDMSQKRLQIDIKKPGAPEEDVECGEDVPSSAEIQVVHEKAIPNLHSILKNRSMSESSECEEYGSSNSSGSPSSPRDEPFCLRRSVSFNERVDKTTFKSSAAVTAITSTLKNKRKRNRKREEKRQSRNRHNSGGSEGSSGDDLDNRNSTSESHSENDVEEEEREEKTVSTMPDDTVQERTEEEVKKPKSEAAIVQNIKDKLSKEDGDEKGDDSDDDGVDDKDNMRTKVEENKSVDVIQSEGDNDNHERTNRDKDEEKEEDCVQGVSVQDQGERHQKAAKGPPRVAIQKGSEDATVSASTVISHSGVQDILDDNQSVIKVTAEERGSGDDSGVECSTDGGGEDKSSQEDNHVETILSWKDQPTNEHATQCSFKFSNAVMFDLDVD